jgi:ribosomal protein S18 acetylase RimI-like enzyme
MNITVIKADYLNPQHEKDILYLLDAYATDPMGGGKPLDQGVKEIVVKKLSELPYAFSLIAYANDVPVGLVNCFESFSTFSAKPLVNIHDFAVIESYRGNGISQIMLDKVEKIAKVKGCCKITLEVLSKNEAAKSAYKKYGFSDCQLDPSAGSALFWQKIID